MTGMGKVYGEVRGGGGVMEQFSGGGGSGGQWRRRRRRVDCTLGNTRPKQGEATVSAAVAAAARGGAAAVAAAEVAVGLLPRSSLSSHLRGRGTPFFLQMTARVCGGVPSPLIEPIVGRERKGPT